MGVPGAYLKLDRQDHGVRPTAQAIADFNEYIVPLALDSQEQQASRCMNCGVAFCQSGITYPGSKRATGCPLHNRIPETNDLLCKGLVQDAYERLSLTNPFPEFTGRVCPAPCEQACNLGQHDKAVTIHDNERAISDFAWEKGLDPLTPAKATAPLVSVIGSGPAGLAAAWELTRLGFRVQVIERDDRAGGLLMYGIPNMKLPKEIIERRIKLMEESGITFIYNTDATENAQQILEESSAVILATGAQKARQMDVDGVKLDGVHYALEYLFDATHALLDEREPNICAKGKNVAVIGGGDTGVDCVATALRQGATNVVQIIRAQCPPTTCDKATIWPSAATIYSQSYGQAEASDLQGEDPRIWSTDTLGFKGDEGKVCAIEIQDLSYEGKRHNVAGTERIIDADLVLIAKGFLGAEDEILSAFDVDLNKIENHRAVIDESECTIPLFVAGDVFMGSTLVVKAIADAIQCAKEVARTLK